MDVAEKVIGIGIGVVIAGIMVPMGLNQIANATLAAGVDPAVSTVFTVVLPVLAVVGIAYAFWKM